MSGIINLGYGKLPSASLGSPLLGFQANRRYPCGSPSYICCGASPNLTLIFSERPSRKMVISRMSPP